STTAFLEAEAVIGSEAACGSARWNGREGRGNQSAVAPASTKAASPAAGYARCREGWPGCAGMYPCLVINSKASQSSAIELGRWCGSFWRQRSTRRFKGAGIFSPDCVDVGSAGGGVVMIWTTNCPKESLTNGGLPVSI